MDHGTNWDVAQWQVVTWLDVCVNTSFDTVSLLQLVRRNDVALFAIYVVQKCDSSCAVRVIFDVRP